MYVIIAGGGKVGANLARTLLNAGREVTLIEQRRDRYAVLEEEFEHNVHNGDATEIFVLERAGIARPPDIVLAVTGDDEDNMIVAQIAKEKYDVPKVIARVNDPRNQAHFDLLGIAPTVSATQSIMARAEHALRGRAARPDRRGDERAQARLPRHPQPREVRWRAGAAVGRIPSEVP